MRSLIILILLLLALVPASLASPLAESGGDIIATVSGTTGTGASSFGGSSGGTVHYQCNDRSDNDNDGNIDYPADLGCSSPTDNTEDSDYDVEELTDITETAIKKNIILLPASTTYKQKITLMQLLAEVVTSYDSGKSPERGLIQKIIDYYEGDS